VNHEAPPGIRALAEWIVRHAVGIRWGSLLLLLASASSLFWLRVDVGLVSMLPSGAPAFESYSEFVSRFAERDAAVAVLRAPDERTGTRFAEDFVAALIAEEVVAGVRGSVDVNAFVDFSVGGGFVRFTTEDFRPALKERLDPRLGPEIAAGIRGVLAMPGSGSAAARMAADPLGFTGILAESLEVNRPDRALSPGSKYLTSADGRRLLLLIQPTDSGYSMEEVARLSEGLARAEAEARSQWSAAQQEDLSIGYTGAFAFAREDAAMMRLDLMRYTGTAFLGVLLIFLVAARSGQFLPILGYHLLLGSLVTLAAGLLVFQRLDVISLAFAAIFYGLAIDAAIHFHTPVSRRDCSWEFPTRCCHGNVGTYPVAHNDCLDHYRSGVRFARVRVATGHRAVGRVDGNRNPLECRSDHSPATRLVIGIRFALEKSWSGRVVGAHRGSSVRSPTPLWFCSCFVDRMDFRGDVSRAT
jgi:hypothetical protein